MPASVIQKGRKAQTSSEPEERLGACWEPEGRSRVVGLSVMGRSMLLATDMPDKRCSSSLCGCKWCICQHIEIAITLVAGSRSIAAC